jgi:SAM-dependent methyltransferase
MSAIYESEKLLGEYLLFHYGSAEEILPSGRTWPAGMREALDFPKRTVAHFTQGRAKRGLDLGCAVGRSTFEMARFCDEVIGIDFPMPSSAPRKCCAAVKQSLIIEWRKPRSARRLPRACHPIVSPTVSDSNRATR